jgi:predicted nucleic acid-binding protein
MILPDMNVLIYAFRRDRPQHQACHSWLATIACLVEHPADPSRDTTL